MARIAVGGFQHETNTFAPQRATWDDFARADAWPGFVRGPELIDAVARLQHPDRRRGRGAAGAGARARAAVLVLGAAVLLCRARRLRAGRRRDARGPRAGGPGAAIDGIYLDLHGAMVAEHHEDGEGELLRRIRALVGDAIADRHQPRLPHQHDPGDGAARQRDGRLPHLPACRHGGDRRPRRRAAADRLIARAPAAAQSLSPDRFPDPAGLAMHRRGAGPLGVFALIDEIERGGRRARLAQPGHRRDHPHSRLSAGRYRQLRPGAGRLRPRPRGGRSRRRPARRRDPGARGRFRRQALRPRRGCRRGAALGAQPRASRSSSPTSRTIPAPAAPPTRSGCCGR